MTLLTTSRMHPALAERIEKSVRGRPGPTLVVRRVIAVARVVLVLGVVFVIGSAIRGQKHARRALDTTRSVLLADVQERRASLSEGDLAVVPRSEAALRSFAGTYEGDVVAAELRPSGALRAALSHPLLYVRGPLEDIATATTLGAVTSKSVKDALVLCLVEPPSARTEKDLLDDVRLAYLGRAEDRTKNVRLLDDAVVGLPALFPPFTDRVRAAESGKDLARLKAELDRVPFARVSQAARSTTLLMVADEPGAGPTELDGERAHAVRIALVDLATHRTLLRSRRSVDPAWVSEARRPTYAKGLDDCALAFDVHASVSGGAR